MVPLIKPASVFLIFFLILNVARSQTPTDSTPVKSNDRDTIARSATADTTQINPHVRKLTKPIRDSVATRRVFDTAKVYHTDSIRFSNHKPQEFHTFSPGWINLLNGQPDFNFSGKPIRLNNDLHEPSSFDGLFYLLLGLLFYFAIIKQLFRKYLANLFTLFFRASMRQQQLREQVLQSPFPSLLLNILFLLNGGMYGAYLLRYYNLGNESQFWLQFVYCLVALALLYLVKFMILKVVGWIFNINRAVETYLFVVFLTNKIIGVFLLPFLVLISFSGPGIGETAVTLSLIMIGIFYIYRFIASYNTLHKEIKISWLYFILYVCAFELAPLMLIYKVLVNYLEKA
jgi:Domain of unknown function (DUF4271)